MVARFSLILLAVISRADAAAPGLALRIEALDKPGLADTREARLIALHVPAGAAPSPFVAPGRFRATWEGEINLKIRERYTFSAEGRGTLTIAIDGKLVFTASGDDLSKTPGAQLRLMKGPNKLQVTYESPAAGDATIRLLWSKPDVPPQPPAPTLYTHDENAPAIVQGRTLRIGRQLVAELRCTKCHAGPADNAFPELSMDAPWFTDIGARLNHAWIAAWIDDPKAIRPDAHMPKMFPTKDGRSADIAAYLASIGSAKAVEQPNPGQVAAGRRLYAALACVACHVPPGATPRADQPARVSHEHVGAKFTPAGLKQYLLDPAKHYAWNPMPDFKLSDDEATTLSAYLLSAGDKPSPEAVPGNAARGATLLASAGCVNCHAGTEIQPQLKAPALASLRAGADCKVADYSLTTEQRSAIAAFLATDRSALTRDEPSEFSERQFTAMRCGHCHSRDGSEALLASSFAAEHEVPTEKVGPLPLAPDQRRFPSLTWSGEKLRPEWARSFMAGEVSYKPRPYLRARMPAFKVRAEGIAAGFAASHGIAPKSEPHETPNASLIAAGQKLIGTDGGFSCVQCHSVAGAPALTPFEAPALDLAHVTQHLRKDFYFRWMHNPIALDPGTKMPRFGDEDGKSPLRDLFDGDVARQHEAIWHNLLHYKGI